MPRPKLRREPCDCRDCVDAHDAQPLADQKHPAALLDPPPKCVVLIGDAFLALSTDSAADAVTDYTEQLSVSEGQRLDSLQAADCPHMDRLAQDGCSGFVALRSSTGARVESVCSRRCCNASAIRPDDRALLPYVSQGCQCAESKTFSSYSAVDMALH